jgi:hypothetical protein
MQAVHRYNGIGNHFEMIGIDVYQKIVTAEKVAITPTFVTAMVQRLGIE